ncbi:MAG: hypothetical protein Q8Q60_02645 [Candidatus Chromulinivorax sp.]|nr:hypothetical protein [Candidatus Chromulinivorax sp.]
MKPIFTYIFSLFLVTNLAYGSEKLNSESDFQQITYPYYEKSSDRWTATKKYINTHDFFTRSEIPSGKISPLYNWIQLEKYRLGLYTSLVDRYIHKDEAHKINNPKSREFDGTELPFFLSRYCLENIDHYIQKNLIKQKEYIGRKTEYYEIHHEEIQRRILLFEKSYRKRCKQDSDSESEDEAPANRRQRTKPSSNL